MVFLQTVTFLCVSLMLAKATCFAKSITISMQDSICDYTSLRSPALQSSFSHVTALGVHSSLAQRHAVLR